MTQRAYRGMTGHGAFTAKPCGMPDETVLAHGFGSGLSAQAAENAAECGQQTHI